MSSYNTITKLEYSGNQSDLVTLNEYIMFQDDKAKRKYIVFKFTNNVTQQLLGMKFEVDQYNVDGELIEKSIVIYNKFLAGAEEEFVPKAKLRVGYECATISIKLMEAAFDRFIWKEGEIEDNSYKFDHFFHDEQQNNAQPAKPKRVKQPKAQKPKKVKKYFYVKDATRKNLAKFPIFFNVCICLAVVIFTIVSVCVFKVTSPEFTVDGYVVRQIGNSKEVAVSGYVGKDYRLVIPTELDGYKVTKIDERAFAGADIVSVTFECSIIVEQFAFDDCTNLERAIAKSDYTVTVMQGAFNNCKSLRTVTMPNSSFEKGSLSGCSEKKILSYGKISGGGTRSNLFEPIAQSQK